MDTKLHTFLRLCQTMNYRMAAERLHLSQPAVTKQIQALEQSLQTKLFTYDGHTLHKTEKCLLLERYFMSYIPAIPTQKSIQKNSLHKMSNFCDNRKILAPGSFVSRCEAFSVYAVILVPSSAVRRNGSHR